MKYTLLTLALLVASCCRAQDDLPIITYTITYMDSTVRVSAEVLRDSIGVFSLASPVVLSRPDTMADSTALMILARVAAIGEQQRRLQLERLYRRIEAIH